MSSIHLIALPSLQQNHFGCALFILFFRIAHSPIRTYLNPLPVYLFRHGALQISSGIWDLDGVRLPLLGCLVGCWLLVFLCLLRGVRSVGRVVWVTVLAPYAFLFVILVRGLFLDGAIDGIYYFVFPRVEKLLDLKARQHVFTSASVATCQRAPL